MISSVLLLFKTARGKNLSIDFLSNNLFWLILSPLFFGRMGAFIYHVYPEMRVRLANTDAFQSTSVFTDVLNALYIPEQIYIPIKYFFTVWEGGFNPIWIVLGFLSTFIFIAIRQKEEIWKWLDAFVLPGLMFTIFVQIASFFAGWEYGRPISQGFPKWLSVSYDSPSVTYAGDLYPVQIFATIIFIAIFIYGKKLWGKFSHSRSYHKDGTYFGMMLAISSFANILLEFFRGDRVKIIFGWMRFPQAISIILFIITIAFLLFHTHEKTIHKEKK